MMEIMRMMENTAVHIIEAIGHGSGIELVLLLNWNVTRVKRVTILLNQEFALGFNLVYIHDKDWLCSGWSCNAQTSKFVCRLPKPIRTWSPRRFPFGHVSGHVDTWTRGRFKIAGYLKYIHMSWPQEKSFIFLGSILARSRGLQCCVIKSSKSELNWLTILNLFLRCIHIVRIQANPFNSILLLI